MFAKFIDDRDDIGYLRCGGGGGVFAILKSHPFSKLHVSKLSIKKSF